MKKRFLVAVVLVAVVAAALPFVIPVVQNTSIGNILNGVMGGSKNEAANTESTSGTPAPSPEAKKETNEEKSGNTQSDPKDMLSNQSHAHKNPNANEKLFLLAVKSNDIGTAEQMLKAGVDVNGVWPDANSYSTSATAFSVALRGKNLDMMQFLLKNGADVNGYYDYNNYRYCYLERATNSEKDIEIVKFLLNNGADVNGYTSRNDGVKTMAIDNCTSKSSERHAAVAQLLIEQGAYLENKDEEGFTPFLRAINQYSSTMMRIFAAAGADLSAKDKKGRDGLQIAIDNKDLQLYKDVQEVMNQGQKPSKYRPSDASPQR